MNGMSNLFGTIPNADTFEEVQEIVKGQSFEEKRTKEKEDYSAKIKEISTANETIMKKVASFNDTIRDIMKALCSSCGGSVSQANNESSQNLCSQCNTIFCSDCVKLSSCLECHRRVCEKHCIKCTICSRRSCKDKNCIFYFKICQSCECTYCQEHFESHKRFNQNDGKLSCTTTNCRLFNDLGKKGIEDFSLIIVNSRKLKDLRIRKNIIRK